MTRVTKFSGRDSGPAARVGGFVAHLRDNGFRVGVAEAEASLMALAQVEPYRPTEAKSALKTVLTGCREEFERFDTLFDSFWMNGGRVTERMSRSNTMAQHVHSSRPARGADEGGASGEATAPDQGEGESNSGGEGKLVATLTQQKMRRDLRHVVQPDEIKEAEAIAHRLGAALRDRRSRRRKAAQKGDRIHFRKLMRQSLQTGGEPLQLPKKKRPDRPRKIVTICDVSGSMTLYAQVFLAFVAGLMRADDTADAYLFHTRLVRIAEALRDRDPMRALGRLSVLADGFGGGSKIGTSLLQFSKTYARRFVDGRTVVVILSDGYDTGAPEQIGEALALLKKRGCRIIWLNPLKGWDGYEPVAAGMRHALPHLDLFRPANTLADLAALETELMRL
ncbi:VWA domain-containing protein [Marivivens sp. LCG002]|uniref:vWA domain-containing protein n=1 Tax=Marivivens sp. LCG002 TaxID=3051171 RepID=UPI0025564D31|nr:VWA domain-containing protein [Marivivens sp. LCG002]WIV51189.1 VWA domain-containing protein [Marivivens sp. LCG002]